MVSDVMSQEVAVSQFRSTYKQCVESGQNVRGDIYVASGWVVVLMQEDELFVSITGAINTLENSLSMDEACWHSQKQHINIHLT